MAFASVTKHCAKYYDQTGDRIDLLQLVAFIVEGTFWLFNGYAIEAWGLKVNLRAGGIISCLGKNQK